ncbi:putative sodium calcium transporter [Golovinomyces cichoracearum]|uniref:Putative sodium calcium transporter n=1 Tax=Golovinomyces cichoracearum TaxID=62708 RepID=A0A420IBM3_9PEZI|nr:putative sodium calcium transporter [Golovinomyces cichoracearum]
MSLDWASIISHGWAFISAIVMFQYSAEKFTKYSAVLARQAGVPETAVSLISTSVAEWEELSIIIATLIQREPTLGLGNIMGSSVGNVLGAFSLVMFLSDGFLKFDSGAKTFALVSFIMTSLFSLLTWQNNLGIQGGIYLVVAFFVYVFSIFSAIYEGMIKPLNLATSNRLNQQDEASSEVEENFVGDEETAAISLEENTDLSFVMFPSIVQCPPTEISARLSSDTSEPEEIIQSIRSYHDPQSFEYRLFFRHASRMLMGFLVMFLSGFVATYSVAVLAVALDISNYIAGVTILSLAAPLPERLVKFSYTKRLRSDILMASTAGTNIVLLTLCMGIFLLAGDESENNEFHGSVRGFDLWVCWSCSLILVTLAWIGGRPYIGGILLVCYIIYLGCELIVFKK